MKYVLPAAPVVATIAALAVLSGCGSSTSSAPSAASSSALPSVQPCDEVDAGAISTTLGQTVRVDTGSADAPVCFLRPSAARGAAFDLNYQWFYVDGLDAYFKSAKLPAGSLHDVKVPGADAAKIIVNKTAKAYQATGYVQNGALVQSVNAAGAPSDGARILAATKLILTQLSAKAPSTPTLQSSTASSPVPSS